VGLSIYSDVYEFFASEKGSERHHQMLLQQLHEALLSPNKKSETKTYEHLHLIAEKLKRRSLVFLFTDMLQSDAEAEKLFGSLQHLKYNKHEIVLFHTFDSKREVEFDFSNRPKRFVDVETNESIALYADTIKEQYEKAVTAYFSELKLRCAQYKIKYVPTDINENFNKILTTYLVER